MSPPINPSVVIPMFNGASSIVAAVGSVLAQSAPVREVVVVDDGSTDGGPDLVRSRFPDVNVIAQESGGPGSARNAGIAASTSDWIAFLDADDIWLPWHTHTLIEMATRFPHVRMVAGAYAPVLPGAVTGPIVRGRAGPIDYFDRAARNSGIVHSSTVALHREVIDRVGGFGPAPRGQDLEMWARAALEFPVAVSSATSALYTIGVGLTAAFERAETAATRRATPTELSAISPSAAVVVDALATGRHLPPARSLRRYLDSRLAWAMRRRIALGDLEGARELRGLASSTRWPENVAPMIVSALPGVAARSLLRAKRSASRRLTTR